LRQPLPWPEGRPFRILSIDGGGIKGIFPAAVLSQAEAAFTGGRSAGDYFDLIAGTSTGGIIALGLGLGLAAAEMLALYRDKGEAIFPPMTGPLAGVQRFYQRWIRGALMHRYARETLERELREVFGERKLGESQRRLCIPAFDGSYNEVHIFKTPHHPDYRLDWNESVVNVALATAAAPTFFPVYRNKGRQFADGGVWANNPVMIGLVDALACQDMPRRAVEILSLGCGAPDRPFSKGQIVSGGLIHWRAIIDAAMQLQSQNANGQAGLLVGADHRLRLSPTGAAAAVEMDDFSAAVALLPTAASEAFDKERGSLERFFAAPANPYVAYHGPRSSQ
jgi:patatin-like phospholipase/acyl hydrolase